MKIFANMVVCALEQERICVRNSVTRLLVSGVTGAVEEARNLVHRIDDIEAIQDRFRNDNGVNGVPQVAA
jgi:hypothetical protein